MEYIKYIYIEMTNVKPSIAQLEERETVTVTPSDLKVIGSIPIRGILFPLW